MNNVQFGAKSSLSQLKAALASQQAAQKAAELKATGEALAALPASDVVDMAQAALAQTLGADKTEFVKTIALGSDMEALPAFVAAVESTGEKTGNVANAMNENFGPKAGAVAAQLAQVGTGLVAQSLQLLRQAAEAAPVVLPLAKASLEEGAAKSAANHAKAAAAVSKVAEQLNAKAEFIPQAAAKVGEVLNEVAARLTPQE